MSILILFILFYFNFFISTSTYALQIVHINNNTHNIDLSSSIDKVSTYNNFLQISTAPDSSNIVRRLEIKSHLDIKNKFYNWIIFALSNDTDEQLEKIIVIPHYRYIGSGLLWPDLDNLRIKNITVSDGFPPDIISNAQEDIFKITIEPGSTITYIAELDSVKITKIMLFDNDYYNLYNKNYDIIIAVILSFNILIILLLLTIYFIKNNNIILVVLFISLAIFFLNILHFNLFFKIFNFPTNIIKFLRAYSDLLFLSSIFLYIVYTFNFNFFNFFKYIYFIVLFIIFTFISYFYPEIIDGSSKILTEAISIFAIITNVYLILKSKQRSLIFFPVWIFFLFWNILDFLILTSLVNSDIAFFILYFCLILFLLLVFLNTLLVIISTLSNYFPYKQTNVSTLALTCSGDFIFELDLINDNVFLSPEFEFLLGFQKGTLSGSISSFLNCLRHGDRLKFNHLLNTLVLQKSGILNFEFRILDKDNNYQYCLLKARPILNVNQQLFMISGIITNVTNYFISIESIIESSFYDKTTKLPNFLFLKQLLNFYIKNKSLYEKSAALIFIEVSDYYRLKFKLDMNELNFIILSFINRLNSFFLHSDSIFKISESKFSILIIDITKYENFNATLEEFYRICSTPFFVKNSKIISNFTTGIIFINKNLHHNINDIIDDVEFALYKSYITENDSIKISQKDLTSSSSTIKNDLLLALQNSEIVILFRPIIKLDNRSIIGFNVSPRWRHSHLGRILSNDLNELITDSDLASTFFDYLFEKIVKEIIIWQSILEMHPPFFASINVTPFLNYPIFFKNINDLLIKNNLSINSIKLEFSSKFIFEQFDKSKYILQNLIDSGYSLVLDSFGNNDFSIKNIQQINFEIVRFEKALFQTNIKGFRVPILNSLVDFFHSIDTKVILDGVESEDDISDLKFYNCDLAQGLAFGDDLTSLEARNIFSNFRN